MSADSRPDRRPVGYRLLLVIGILAIRTTWPGLASRRPLLGRLQFADTASATASDRQGCDSPARPSGRRWAGRSAARARAGAAPWSAPAGEPALPLVPLVTPTRTRLGRVREIGAAYLPLIRHRPTLRASTPRAPCVRSPGSASSRTPRGLPRDELRPRRAPRRPSIGFRGSARTRFGGVMSSRAMTSPKFQQRRHNGAVMVGATLTTWVIPLAGPLVILRTSRVGLRRPCPRDSAGSRAGTTMILNARSSTSAAGALVTSRHADPRPAVQRAGGRPGLFSVGAVAPT